MREKIYIGFGKNIEGKFGPFHKFGFTKKDMQKVLDESDDEIININITKRKEPTAKGITHYGVVDTWKPDSRASPKSSTDNITAEDLPF